MSKQNGLVKEEVKQPPVMEPQPQQRVVNLSPLQRDYLQQYAASLNQATAKLETAKSALKLAEEAEEQAQGAANAFLRFCAEDLDIDLRVWQFDQPNLRFVLVGEGEGNV